MKKMLLIAALLFSLSGCYYEMVDSGEVGVEVRQGIVDKEIKTEGFNFSMVPFVDLDLYNTKSKILEMSKTAVQEDTREIIYDAPVSILTKDNLNIPVDITIAYKLNKVCAPLIRTTYGKDIIWDNKIIFPKAKDVVRSVISKDADVYKLNQNRDKYTVEIQSELTKQIDVMLGQPGCIEIDAVSIKDMKIPDSLNESILRKQKMEEEVRISQLEVEKIKAQAQAEIEKNKGIAQAQEILTKSLTPALIEWKKLEVEQLKVEKWNGVTPTHILNQDATLMIK